MEPNSIYHLIISNKDFLKIIYGLLIGLFCFIIVLRTDKLFRLSMHQGIRYFRNAFFFYGIAFLFRAIIGGIFLIQSGEIAYFFISSFIFEFFLISAGFFLLYSLIWKTFESERVNSSLFNGKIFVFYLIALVLSGLDLTLGGYYFLFLSQVFVFTLATGISFNNLRRDQGKHGFPRFYFLAMLLSLIAWMLNAFAALYFNWSQIIILNTNLINAIIFLLFLLGVLIITKK